MLIDNLKLNDNSATKWKKHKTKTQKFLMSSNFYFRLNQVEDISNPIITKLYGEGAGGAPPPEGGAGGAEGGEETADKDEL